MYDNQGLSAVYINCTLKKTGRMSHTDGIIDVSQTIMEKNGVATEVIRLVDHNVPPGVYPDMTEYGYDADERPSIYTKILEHDILVIGTPIRLGEKSSVCQTLIERLYAQSADTNDQGQYVYYGRVGGCLITGNEDGIKHCSAGILYALQHIGYTIPPQADAGWVGEAGPGPSYLDEGSGGPENDFTNRNVTFMTYNLMHTAALLKQQGGIPAYGNLPKAREAGTHFGHENPEYR